MKHLYLMSFVAVIFVPGFALASDPSFECSKASSSAETAICESDDLAALDRELAGHYARAVADTSLSADRVSELKAMQRGWIKGRDECWKSGLGLEACVATEYVFRIAEIRTGYAASRNGESESAGPYPYVCDGLDYFLSVVFVNTGTPRAAIAWKENAVVATAVPTGSGARYEAGDVVFHTKGQGATLSRGDGSWQCQQDDMG